jgi:hypothetical protein
LQLFGLTHNRIKINLTLIEQGLLKQPTEDRICAPLSVLYPCRLQYTSDRSGWATLESTKHSLFGCYLLAFLAGQQAHDVLTLVLETTSTAATAAHNPKSVHG